jgi:hypothetical protein
VTDEVAYGTDVILHLLGECQRAAHQPGDPLPQCVVEPFDVVRFAGTLGDGFVLSSRHHTGVGSVLIRIEGRLLAVHLPQRLDTPGVPHRRRQRAAHGDAQALPQNR